MKLIQRGNRQLRVDDVQAEELIKEAGYVELDEKTGKPVKCDKAEVDVKALEKSHKDLMKKYEALQKDSSAKAEENKALTEQVAELTAKLEAAEAARVAEEPDKTKKTGKGE